MFSINNILGGDIITNFAISEIEKLCSLEENDKLAVSHFILGFLLHKIKYEECKQLFIKLHLDINVFLRLNDIDKIITNIYQYEDFDLPNDTPKNIFCYDDDTRLLAGIFVYGDSNWKAISKFVKNKTPSQCSQRWRRVLNPKISRNEWQPEEEQRLIELVNLHGEMSWSKIASLMKTRSDVQCRYYYQKIQKQKRSKLMGSMLIPSEGAIPMPILTPPNHYYATVSDAESTNESISNQSFVSKKFENDQIEIGLNSNKEQHFYTIPDIKSVGNSIDQQPFNSKKSENDQIEKSSNSTQDQHIVAVSDIKSTNVCSNDQQSLLESSLHVSEKFKASVNDESFLSDSLNEEEEDVDVFFKGYEKILEKIKKKILDHSKNLNTVFRYAENYLSGKIDLFIYVILESIEVDITTLIRGINLLKIIYRKYSYSFIDSFSSALLRIRLDQTEINQIIILFLQTAYASVILTKDEAEKLLNCYLAEDDISSRNDIFNEKFHLSQNINDIKNEKNKYDLKKEIEHLEKVNKELQTKNEKSTPEDSNTTSNDFLNETLKLEDTDKNGRRYSDMYIAISSIAYIFGPKCYSFLRNYFPLPHETNIRKHISPEIIKYTNSLIDFDGINMMLEEFTSGEKMNATLAVDAATFKNVKGETILKKFPQLKTINPEKIYDTLFVYYIQPINVDVKPFPVHIELTENGSATQTTLDCIDRIISRLKEKNITIDFIATDGDHKYDSFHDNFFEIIFSMHKGGSTFSQIVAELSNEKFVQIPISDFLHSLKIFRNNLVKYGVAIENKNSISVLSETLESYDMGKTLSDLSQHGKMKDCYPMELFSSSNINKAIERGDWNFVFYSLPFNLMINSIRNPNISFELRKFNLEVAYYFMMHYLYQLKDSISPVHSRIGIIRMINTIIGVAIALERYPWVHTGHIGTHPLENYFGSLRISCNNDHSYCNIFRAIGKTIHVKNLLNDLNKRLTIRSRLGYGGVKAEITCIEGIIPDIAPFDLFKMIWQKVKNYDSDSTIFESWFPLYKTIDWTEELKTPSLLSGSSIVSRYFNRKNKKRNLIEKPKMKRRKMLQYNKIREIQRISKMTEEEISSMHIENHFIFFISNNSIIDSHLNKEEVSDDDLKNYMDEQYEISLNLMKKWIKEHF